MAKPCFNSFVYDRPKGPLSANFAANMGDCAQIKVTSEGTKYKSRITKVTSTSHFSTFFNSQTRTPLARNTPVPKTERGVTGKIVPTSAAKVTKEVEKEVEKVEETVEETAEVEMEVEMEVEKVEERAEKTAEEAA